MPKIAGVRFISANGNIGEKIYYYSTDLNLIKGYKYNIENNEGFRYSSPVVVIFCMKYDKNNSYHNECWSKIRCKITKAVNIGSTELAGDYIKTPSSNSNFNNMIYGVWFNKDKRTTVVKWADNTITRVTCSVKDNFSMDAGLALCYTKRWCFNNNSAAFHKEFKKWIKEEEVNGGNKND